jgi:hypothetical protein
MAEKKSKLAEIKTKPTVTSAEGVSEPGGIWRLVWSENQ